MMREPSRRGDVDERRGKSDDGWEVLEEEAAMRVVEDKDRAGAGRAANQNLSESIVGDDGDDGWEEARREA